MSAIPTSLRQPEPIARLSLLLGYEHDEIVEALMGQFDMTREEADELVTGLEPDNRL